MFNIVKFFRFLLPFLLGFCALPLSAQTFTSSNLPIVVIDTQGKVIPNEPKIIVHMGIIDNGPGIRNYVTDVYNIYDGSIAIETRGSTSQMFPKKQYGLELRDAQNQDWDVALLGMPPEEDIICSL
jgi:hypothetical protein